MAYKTVAQVKDSIAGILTGINLNNVQSLNTALERTAREICTRISIPEATSRQAITLYDGVTDYAAPTDIFGAALIDIRPQGTGRNITDFVVKQPLSVFDRTKGWNVNGYQLALEFVKGIGRLRVDSQVPQPRIELDPMSLTTGWAAAGSASGLTQDSTVFYRQPSSLRFNLAGASSGTLTKSVPSNNLTSYIGVGVVFLAIRTPSATNLTSLTLKIGSDASNYYSVTATTGFIEAFTTGEWMLVAFDLSTATTIGSPTITAIDYVQITVTHAAALTNFYVGDLWIALPSPHDLIYQVSAIFQASGANPSQTITNNADSLLLNDMALVIFEYEAATTIAQQQGGTLASGLIAQLDENLNGRRGRTGAVVELGLYDIYRGANPSQELRLTSNYYDD